MNFPFIGREDELLQLRKAFELASGRRLEDPPDRELETERFSSHTPQLVALVGESGRGKSRLVQELYQVIANDEASNPPGKEYWPTGLTNAHNELNVNPSFDSFKQAGPPQFIWIGARCPPQARNGSDDAALLTIREQIDSHVEVFRRNGHWFKRSIDAAVDGNAKDFLKEKVVGGTFSRIPGGGTAKALIALLKAAERVNKELGQSADRQLVVREQARSRSDQLLSLFQSVQSVRKPVQSVPMVLWIDDAHGAAVETYEFIQRLWERAREGNWKLLILITHWEREWYAPENSAPRWASLTEPPDPRTTLIPLSQDDSDVVGKLIDGCLPGLSGEQRRRLQKRTSGNLRQLQEILVLLQNDLDHFEGGDPSKQLSTVGEKKVGEFPLGRTGFVQERFNELDKPRRHLLGWSSQLGNPFLKDLSEETSKALRRLESKEPSDLIQSFVPPRHVILAETSSAILEFPDPEYWNVARAYWTDYGGEDERLARAALKEQLIGWVQQINTAEGMCQAAGGEARAPSSRWMTPTAITEDGSIFRAWLNLCQRELDVNAHGAEGTAARRASALALEESLQSGDTARAERDANSLHGVDWTQTETAELDERALLRLARSLRAAGQSRDSREVTEHLLTLVPAE